MHLETLLQHGGMIHNARLVNVQPDLDGGHELLTVEVGNRTVELAGGDRWSEEFSRRDVGLHGYLVPAAHAGNPMAEGWYFRSYLDQTLRRVPELDAPDPGATKTGRVPNVIGWYCDTCPTGFRAPIGLVPGRHGDFYPDQTIPVALRVPPEFVRVCKLVQRSPEEVLRGFIADASGILNEVASPRADGFSSNGSDEREYAQNWLDRAYGMFRLDPLDFDTQQEAQEERDSQLDELADLLDDYVERTGDPDGFMDAVRAIGAPYGVEQGEGDARD